MWLNCPKLIVLLGVAAILQVGCSAPVAEGMPASDSDGMPPWHPPQSGITGTPADNVTDAVLDENGLIVLPNPYPVMITDWQRLPAGRTWGAGPAGGLGPDGHYWQYDRCGADSYDGCVNSTVDPILKFDVNTGALLTSFGSGEIVVPHGLHVDREGNNCILDMAANEEGTRGFQVLKYNAEGEILMRLGTGGVSGTGPYHLEERQVVVVAPNGDIFISEGHAGEPGGPGRIKKYSADGEFILEWGRRETLQARSGTRIQWPSTYKCASSSPTAATIASRSSTRMVTTPTRTTRMAGLAAWPSGKMYCIRRTAPHRGRVIPAGCPAFGSGSRRGGQGHAGVRLFPPHGHRIRPLGACRRGIAVDANGTIIYHPEDISFPGLQGLDLRPRQ